MAAVAEFLPVKAARQPIWALDRSRAFWLVLAGILTSRLVLLIFAKWLPGDDGLRYLQEAENLIHYGTFSHLEVAFPLPTTHDLPLFPLLLSALLRILPEPAAAMRLMGVWNAFFFTAAAGAIFQLARLIATNSRVPVIAACLFALCPESLPYSLFSMPESLFLMLFLWAVVLQATFLQGAPWRQFFASYALLGTSILAKPASLFFAAVFVMWGVCFWPRKQVSAKMRAGWLAIGLLTECAVVSPWIVRNQLTFGIPALTTITGTNLFDANYRFMLEDQHVTDPDAELARQTAGLHWANPVEEANIKGSIAKREILAHWRDYLATNLKRHPRLYVGTGALALLRLFGDSSDVSALETWQARPAVATSYTLPKPVLLLQLASWLFLGLLYAGAAIGIILLIRHRAWFALAFTVFPIFYFAAVIGPVVYTRYRLPMDPFFALLAAYCTQKVKA